MNTSKYVVYVDDDEDDRFLLQQSFAPIPQCMLQALDSGAALFELLQTTPAPALPRLIILDINMPQLTGVEVLRQLRANEKTRHIPVIMFSTTRMPRESVECIALDAAFEVKPGRKEELDLLAKKFLSLCG